MAGGVLSLTESAARAQAMHALLPAPEVAAIVRSQGFEPISPLMRRGNSYVLRAAGPDGRELRVVVAARSGDIISATPVVPAGPAGDRLGAYERMDGPPPPIVHEGDRPMRRPMATIPNPPPRIARGPAPEMQDLPPMGPQAEPPVIMREERGEHGLLPPPKPRPNPDGENQAGEVKRWGEEPAKPEVAAEPQPSPAAPKPSVAPMSEDKVDARQLPN
jgi:hypothetical protein